MNVPPAGSFFRMNYRHAFHAGNFADVFKHALLLALLDALAAKDKPLCYLDTHAGAGKYALDETHALKTGEWREGVGRLFSSPQVPQSLQRYVGTIRVFNPGGELRVYPGSPLLAANALRASDRLVLCELQPDEAKTLRALFRNDARAHVHARDGYAALKGLLPPVERRGLVLIDPPFEQQAQEFRAIETALKEAHARWPTGVYAVWYPIKRRATIRPFERWLAGRGWRGVSIAELLVRADDSPLRLNGCGMAIVNAPWQIDAAFASILSALQPVLAQEKGATYTLRTLT
ncbi:MAG: 23S rRNA (adenine(2030)-N(6))-methyltransferase RlmJ [Rhodanobacteraceae bacterium]